MNLLLKHIKWHSKVKIIFLVKLALIDITSAFESWASAPQLEVAPTVLQPGFCWSSYPEGWLADHWDTSPLCSHLKEFLAHSLAPGILNGKGIAFGPCTRVAIFLYTFLIIKGRNSCIKSPLLPQHRSRMELGKKKGSKEQRAQGRRWGQFQKCVSMHFCLLSWGYNE